MKILDACCGGKMFWYEKNLEFVDFQDNRELHLHMKNARSISFVTENCLQKLMKNGVIIQCGRFL